MKKIVFIMLAVFGLNALTAQTNTAAGMQTTPPGANTPVIVTNKFSADYPNISPTWHMEGDHYAADYKDKITGTGRSVIYDRNGNIVSYEAEVGYNIYPPSISEYFKKNYPDEKYTVWSSEDVDGTTVYYSKRKDGKIVWFNEEGNYSVNRPLKAPKKTIKTKSAAK